MDVFHEREVPRHAVIGVLKEPIADGVDVSIHMSGLSAEDICLEGLTALTIALGIEGALCTKFVNNHRSMRGYACWAASI